MAKSKQKTAVVLIHGIGDQRPMENLRSFVETVLSAYPKPRKPPAKPSQRPLYWSKPDRISDSFEMRRLNAYPGGGRPPVDFYEFYWAHLMEGTDLRHTADWIGGLLFRRPGSVPAPLRTLWWLTWFGMIALGILVYCYRGVALAGAAAVVAAVLVLAIKSGFGRIMRDWVGDAARYFSPNPRNVGVRNIIRKSGVDMIRRLHESGEYRRIVVVGHSLGSVIALDLLYHYWIVARERHAHPDEVNQQALKAMETAMRGNPDLPVAALREHQKAVAKELRDVGVPWNVTDLVTLGSPLTHLPFLLGLSAAEFDERLMQREFPKCPPILDNNALSYPSPHYVSALGNIRSLATLHHAACFAATRWTNIYFRHDGWFGGDPVGGPLSGIFGNGISDIIVKTRHWAGRVNHLVYWRRHRGDIPGAENPVDALYKALALDE